MWANTQKTSTGVEPAPRDLKGLSGRSKNGTRAITWHVVSSLYTHGLGRSSQIWRLFTCGVILASGCNTQEINLPVRVPSLTPKCISLKSTEQSSHKMSCANLPEMYLCICSCPKYARASSSTPSLHRNLRRREVRSGQVWPLVRGWFSPFLSLASKSEHGY